MRRALRLMLTVVIMGSSLSVGPLIATANGAVPVDVAKIVFHSSRDGNNEIYWMNPDGTGPRRLTNHGSTDITPNVSPDGKIAFSSGRSGNQDIWVMDSDGTNLVQLTSTPLVTDIAPKWSPDGTKIGYSTTAGDVMMMNADGSAQATVLTGALGAWSPDGSKITYYKNDGTDHEVFVANADGSSPVQLTNNTTNDSVPDWSSTNKIVFQSNRDGNFELYTINPDGTGEARVTTTVTNEATPSWSPDGSSMAFVLNGQIYVMPAGGGTATVLTVAPAFNSSPDWALFEMLPGITSTGQTLSLTIDSPADASTFALPQAALDVAGTATISSLDQATDPLSIVYIIDVSGSTSTQRNLNCDGVAGITAADNLNSDAFVGDILDCEIAGVAALNKSLEPRPETQIGMVGFGVGAAAADMQPAAEIQLFTAPGADLSPLANKDVETVARSHRAGTIGLFRAFAPGANGTNYGAALLRARDSFNTRPAADTKTAYFLSDGIASTSTTQTGINAVKAIGVTVHTYSLGTSGPGCGASSALRAIADQTGGTCTAVANPALLTAALVNQVTIQKVEVSINGGSKQLANFAPSTGAWSASLANPTSGTNSIVATVTASDGTTLAETISVTALAPPEADAGGPYSVNEGESIVLDATASDFEGGALSYAWTPDGIVAEPNVEDPTYDGTDDGTVQLTLVVSDPDGLSSTDTADVTTLNVAPALGTIDVPAQINEGEAFDVSAFFTDPGTLDTYTASWDWGDGTTTPGDVGATPGAAADEQTATGTHTYAQGGSYTITLTVTDDDGGAAQTTVGPFDVNRTPQVDAGGPYSVDEGSSVTLDGTASDPDGDLLQLAWTPNVHLNNASLEDPTFTGVDDAIADLTFTATDGGGLFSADSTEVQVLNVAPVMGPVQAPAEIRTGQLFSVAGNFTDPGTGDTHKVRVDWGDGTTTEDDLTVLSFDKGHHYNQSGTYLVEVTVIDDDGGTDSEILEAVVVNSPPVVDAGGPYTVVEGSSIQLDASVSDPDGDTVTLAWTPTDELLFGDTEDPIYTGVDDGTVTLELTATDPFGASGSDTAEVTVLNAAPELGSIVGPEDPVALGSAINVTTDFNDPGTLDTHTSTINWGDGSTSPADVTGSDIAGSHTYAEPGIYTVSVTVTDDDGGDDTAIFQYAVVYDPDGGFVTGGGHFDSPPGAYAADLSAAGKATFGFVAKYKKGAEVPEGSTEFKFSAGSLNFKSTDYQWLVVSGRKAQYKGHGTINGGGSYAFMLSAIDGNLQGGDNIDRFRIRIWDRDSGGLVYDNEVGSDGNGDPSTAITGGSIVIHKS